MTRQPEPPTDQRRTEYIPLDTLRPAHRNPKKHDLDRIRRSIAHFGFTAGPLLDERTGQLVAGHGRLEALAAMRDMGQAPPAGIRLTEDGAWLVPVQRGWASRSDEDAEAYLVTDNRLTELGGWEIEDLADLLEGLNEVDPALLELAGYDADGLAELLAELEDEPAGAGGDEPRYSGKVDSIQYQIQGDRPPVSSLVNRDKAVELLAAIDAAPDVPDEVRAFLRAAAQRHLVFDYAKIAEFYAHAEPDVQRLMEQSALVIVDYDDAIDLGYVRLSKVLDELRIEQREGEEAEEGSDA